MGTRRMRVHPRADSAETECYKWGKSPDQEFKLAIDAMLKACADAGLIRRTSTVSRRIATIAVRLRDCRRRLAAAGSASMEWGGGGGGGSGAIANGAAAIATGQAECVVVFRGRIRGFPTVSSGLVMRT